MGILRGRSALQKKAQVHRLANTDQREYKVIARTLKDVMWSSCSTIRQTVSTLVPWGCVCLLLLMSNKGALCAGSLYGSVKLSLSCVRTFRPHLLSRTCSRRRGVIHGGKTWRKLLQFYHNLLQPNADRFCLNFFVLKH